MLADFLTHLSNLNYAPSSITSFISAISFVHKLLGVTDPANEFIIKQALKGARRMAGSRDGRLPITRALLVDIINAAVKTLLCNFTKTRFVAMCSLAFHALLRLGEMTNSENNLMLLDVKVETGRIIFQFRFYKHSQGVQSTHNIPALPGSLSCPVENMSKFLALRGRSQGPLFTTVYATAVDRRVFSAELRTVIQKLGLDPKRYTSHSFRIGAASSLAAEGESDAQIRQAGRWVSSAFLSYIR